MSTEPSITEPSIEPSIDTHNHTGKIVIRLAGDQPSPLNPPSGCHFHPRCPHASELCRQTYPEKTDTGKGHGVHCHWVAGQSGATRKQPI